MMYLSVSKPDHLRNGLKSRTSDLHSIDKYLAARLVCCFYSANGYFYDAFIFDHCSIRGDPWGESGIENSVSSRVNLYIRLGFVWKTILFRLKSI